VRDTPAVVAGQHLQRDLERLLRVGQLADASEDRGPGGMRQPFLPLVVMLPGLTLLPPRFLNMCPKCKSPY